MIRDTPFDERCLTIFAAELAPAPPWPARLADALLDRFDPAPWRPFTEMRGGVDEPWRPYSRAKARSLFPQLGLQVPGEPLYAGSMYCGFNGNNARVSMQAADYEAGGGAATVEGWIERTLAVLPEPASARANADGDQMMFRRDRKLPVTREPFGEIGWLHVLYPAAYRDNFERRALLAAPCHRVEERGGAIWLWVYDEPFHYDTPTARDTHAELRIYLDENAKP